MVVSVATAARAGEDCDPMVHATVQAVVAAASMCRRDALIVESLSGIDKSLVAVVVLVVVVIEILGSCPFHARVNKGDNDSKRERNL
jgi:hypothetical protein